MSSPETRFNQRFVASTPPEARQRMRLWRASDQQTGGGVLLAEFTGLDADGRASIEQLARQTAALRHDLLLPLLDHFATDDGYALVCPDPGGRDLARSLAADGAPRPERDLLIQAQLLLGLLDYLHAQRPPLFIGDLVPADVIVTETGAWRLSPFPLVSPIDSAPSSYRAPELSEVGAEPTVAGDLYAVGALLYQLLTGYPPPTAGQRANNTLLVSPRSINAAISPLVEQCLLRALQVKALNRYQAAREMRIALETVQMLQGRSLGLAADQPPQPTTPITEPIVTQPAAPPASSYTPPATHPPLIAIGAMIPSNVAPPVMPPPQQAPPAKSGRGPSIGCLIGGVIAITLVLLTVCGLVAAFFISGGARGAVLPGQTGLGAVATLVPSPAATVPGAAPTEAPSGARPTTVAPQTRPPLAADAITLRNAASITNTAEITATVLGPDAYSPDGSRFAIGVSDDISLRNGTDLTEIVKLTGHTGKLTTLAFSADGALLASGASGDPLIRVWDGKTGKLLRTLNGHAGWIRSLAFAPSGTTLASGSTDLRVKLWDAASGQELATLTGHTSMIGGVAFSPDGKRLASAARDGTVRMWDVVSGAAIASFSFETPNDASGVGRYWATGVTFSPDGSKLAVGVTDNNVYMLDASSGKQIALLVGHTNWVVIRGVLFTPDGKTLITAALDGSIRLWDVASGKQTDELQGHRLDIFSIALTADGKRLASVSDQEGRAILWDMERKQATDSLRVGQGIITALTYSSDGVALASTGYNGVAAVRLLKQNATRSFSSSAAASQGIALFPSGQFALIDSDNAVSLINLNTQQTAQIPAAAGQPLAIASSRDGVLLAIGYSDGTVGLFDAKQETVIATLRGSLDAAVLLAFNSDHSLLAAAGSPASPKVAIWNTASGKLVGTMTDAQRGINALAFQPGSAILAAASLDGNIWLYDSTTAGLVRSIAAAPSDGWYAGMDFSADGSLIIGGSAAGAVIFIDSRSDKEVARVEQPSGVSALAVRPDGSQIAVALRDNSVQLLSLTK